jgi:hypothetical protein
VATTSILLLVAATPIGALWFRGVSALPPPLERLASAGMWIAFALPAMTAFQSWYQGVIVHSRRTRGVTESMALSLGTTLLVLGVGVALQRWTGLFVALAAMVAGNAVQALWLRVRARRAFAALAAGAPAPVASVVALAGETAPG